MSQFGRRTTWRANGHAFGTGQPRGTKSRRDSSWFLPHVFSARKRTVHSFEKSSPSKPQRSPLEPYEPCILGLVSTSTSSSTNLKARLSSLRGGGSVQQFTKPYQATLTSSQLTFETASSQYPPPNTSALTVAVETLAPDPEVQEDGQPPSDTPTSSSEPPPETPSPTVSYFAQDSEAQAVEISDHHTPSHTPSARTVHATLRSSLANLKNFSKASLSAPAKASKRALAHIKRSRKSLKAPSEGLDPEKQDTDTFFEESDPDPFRTWDAETPASVTTEPFTEEPEGIESGGDPDTARPSPTSSRAPSTVRRRSFRSSISRLGQSLRHSTKVSFPGLSRISSSRSQPIDPGQPNDFESVVLEPVPQAPPSSTHAETPAVTRPSSATDALFPTSPDFPPPRARTWTQSQPNGPPISVQTIDLPLDAVPEVISPYDLTASPSVVPSELDSPAVTTLPPRSRPQSWWFSHTQAFARPANPEASLPPVPELPQQPGHPPPEPLACSQPPTTRSKSSRSLFRQASSSQVAAQLPVPQPSAPSAAPSRRSERSASAPSLASAPYPRRVPTVGRSSESVLFPVSRGNPFGESQADAPQTQAHLRTPSQIPLPPSTFTTPAPSVVPTRAPSRTPSQTPLPPSGFTTPAPSIPSRSRHSSTKTQARASLRQASSRNLPYLPTIISSRGSTSNLKSESTAVPEPLPFATNEPVSPAAQDSPPPVPPIAITAPSTPSASPQNSPPPSRGTSTRKTRSRSGSRSPSTKRLLRSLASLPIFVVGSKEDLRARLSHSSRSPSQQPSHASLRTHATAPQPPSSPPTPPAQSPNKSRLPSRRPSFSSRRASRRSSNPAFFTPARRPSRQFAPRELETLPEHLVTSDGEQIEIPAEILARMPFNDNNIPIDAGIEDEYEERNWFENPPPKPEPRAPETVSPPYVPMPGVVEQNEAFIYALQAAPNVLYGSYKQYGQLGVLGWCAEFSELIDSLKNLGFDGNMFVNTRTQALATCQELLKLRLDLKMQIIIMYLSSQVARLRRFLDGEGEYNDYPNPEFPLDVRTYT